MCVCSLTVLSHELVELVECLRVFRCWVVWRVLLWTGFRLLGVGGRRLTAVAAHKGRQNGRVVHSPVQSPKQCPHALDYSRRVSAFATAISISASSTDRKRLHLQLLPRAKPPFSVHVFGSGHADGVLPPIAEATMLVLVVLQEVVDRSQPQRVAWAQATAASAGAVTMSITTAITASSTAIGVHLFTPFTGLKQRKNGRCIIRFI